MTETPEAQVPKNAHEALLLMDRADGLVRWACVSMTDPDRYRTEAAAFWAVVEYLRGVRDHDGSLPITGGPANG
jgi:hypothetical protein